MNSKKKRFAGSALFSTDFFSEVPDIYTLRLLKNITRMLWYLTQHNRSCSSEIKYYVRCLTGQNLTGYNAVILGCGQYLLKSTAFFRCSTAAIPKHRTVSQISGSVLASRMYIWLTFDKSFTNELYCAGHLRQRIPHAVRKEFTAKSLSSEPRSWHTIHNWCNSIWLAPKSAG